MTETEKASLDDTIEVFALPSTSESLGIAFLALLSDGDLRKRFAAAGRAKA